MFVVVLLHFLTLRQCPIGDTKHKALLEHKSLTTFTEFVVRALSCLAPQAVITL